MREHKVNYQRWYRKVPTILLSGDWLTACGFDPADEISVSARNGHITIKKIADEK
jgi:hypothetical protein